MNSRWSACLLSIAIGNLFWFESSRAAINNHTPASGETVIGDTSPPNPDTIGVEAVAGSTNVTVNILTGAEISVININGIFVRDQSAVTNQGAITVAGDTFGAIRFDSNNIITNSGTISTSGLQSEGMFTDGGQNNTLLNDNAATITTSGPNSSGMLVFGGATGNAVTNLGTITTSGALSRGVAAIGDANILTNGGTITTTGEAAHGLFGNGASNTLINNGTIGVSGVNAYGINSVGTGLGPITNSGVITAAGLGGLGAFIGGPATFTNTLTGSIMSLQASGIIANGGGTITNAGAITGQATGITTANGAAIVTNSGTIAGLTAPGLIFEGNFDNSLTNTGTINGNGLVVNGRPTAVQFGAGDDTLNMQGGTINGFVGQGDGVDILTMTGGTIGSIDQGLGLDTATISDGRIIGAFTSGDFVTMTGGQIGSVELRTGNNVMRMSGGSVDGDVSAEQGNDLFELSGGSIGGKLDLGSGNNTINVTGGAIGNGIVTLTGTDQLTWSDAGTIAGAINLGDGDDIATLRNLTSAIMMPTTALNGGPGNDTLNFDNVETSGVSRFQSWETLALTNGSRLTLDGNLVMGDAGTQTGIVSIDATSIVFAGSVTNPSILPFTAGQLVTAINAGVIDLTNGPVSPNDRLTITGNYVGTNGRLLLHTFLGDDNSPSDRLIISGGSATGRTVVGIINVGGPGALTRSEGILVVQAVNATTAPTAFVQSGRIVAGAYEYFLFRGGASPGSRESWFLRSTLIPGSQPAAQQTPLAAQPAPPPITAPSPPGPGPLAAQPTPPPITAASPPSPGGPAIPLFRPEVPVYAVVPGTTRLLVLSILSTFHERRGEQSLLQGKGIAPAAWGRFLGQRVERQWGGAATPEFDGSILGLEVGLDLASFEIASGHVDRLGLFFAYAQASGDVSGLAIGEQQKVGHERINSYGLGGYWTHIGPTGWYIDTVLTGLWFDGDADSNFGTGIDVSGNSIATSIEAGYPIPLTRQISLEPQAQFIWQHFWLDDERDAFSTVGFNTSEGFTGRVGLRLRGSFSAETIFWQPYLKVNLWQGFGADDEVLFGGSDTISSEQQTTALEAGGGIVTKIGEVVALYVTLSWTNDLDGNTVHSLGGNFGLRVAW